MLGRWRAAARPGVRAPARRGPRSLGGGRPGRVRLDRRADSSPRRCGSTVIYELHIGTFTEEGTFDAAIAPCSTNSSTLGVTAVEAHAGRPIPGPPELGLRRGLPLRRPGHLRRTRRASSGSSRPATGGAGGDPRRRLQPPGPRGQRPRGLRSLFHGPLPDALGARGQRGRRRARTRSGAIFVAQRPRRGSTTSTWTPSAWTRSTASSTTTARPFLADLSDAVDELAARPSDAALSLIAESADNDPRVLAPTASGGLGIDAQWNDDFHHALHTVLTGERAGYYADFGTLDEVATHRHQGILFRGQYSRVPAAAPRRAASPDIDPGTLVVSSPRTTTRSATGRAATGSRPWSTPAGTPPGRGGDAPAVAAASRCCSWGRSTARAPRSPTSSTTGTPSSPDAVRRGREAEMDELGLDGRAARPDRSGAPVPPPCCDAPARTGRAPARPAASSTPGSSRFRADRSPCSRGPPDRGCRPSPRVRVLSLVRSLRQGPWPWLVNFNDGARRRSTVLPEARRTAAGGSWETPLRLRRPRRRRRRVWPHRLPGTTGGSCLDRSRVRRPGGPCRDARTGGR